MADVSYKALVNDDEAPSSGSATSDSVPISPPVSSDDTSASNDTSNVEAGATADSKKKIPYTRQQKTILVIVMISQFFAMTSISLPAPFLPKMDESHGVSSDYTGWLIGIGSLIQLFISPFVGKMVPHVGLHTMIVFGAFFCGGVTALTGTLQYLPPKGTFTDPDMEFLVLAFILRSIYALGYAAFSAAGMTILSVVFPDTTTTILSYSETVVGLGVMVGPAMGSGFFAIGGFMTTFAANGAIMISCSILMYFLLPYNVGYQNEEDSEPVSIRSLLTDVNIIYGLILTAYSATMWACIDPILEPELRTKYELKQELSALSFIILSVTYSIFSILAGKFLEKVTCIGNISVMLFGYTLMAINFIPMGPSPLLAPWLDRPMWLLLTCVGVLGAGLGCTIVPGMSLLFDGDGDGKDESEGGNSGNTAKNAMLSSFWAGAYALGDWAGPMVSGLVIKNSNFGWTMTGYFFSTVAIIVLVLALKIYQGCTRCCAGKPDLTLTVNKGYYDEDERKPLLSAT